MKVEVKTLDAAGSGEVELNDAVFGVEPRADILHRVVTWQLTNRRGPARAARERSDVARTGKKLGKQKGGGPARPGGRRAPSPAPARSSASRRAAARLATAIGARRSSSAAARRTAPVPASSCPASTRR